MGPMIVGVLVQRIGNFVSSMVAMGAFLCAAGLMMVGLATYMQCSKRRGRKQVPAGRSGSDPPVDSRTDLLGSSRRTNNTNGKDAAAQSDVELGALPNARAHSIFKV